ncbi:MAG: site-specific integrase [Ruminococcus sp.]|nr:site-specific integrase [Ruminococcus sp.]
MWSDIDFGSKTIFISRTLADIGGKHFLTPPKTESSIRTIGMSEALCGILIAHKAQQEQLVRVLGTKCAHPEMVFTSALGNYCDRQSVYHTFKMFTKGTEFEDMTLHQLRHCCATLLLNSGVDLKIVSEHLGHSGVEVTANVYADVLKSSKMKVAELISLKLA